MTFPFHPPIPTALPPLATPSGWPSKAPPSGLAEIAPDDIETRLQLAAAEDPEVRKIVSANICRCCGRGG